jgi:tetratricopeptide (TPR) repeat protein
MKKAIIVSILLHLTLLQGYVGYTQPLSNTDFNIQKYEQHIKEQKQDLGAYMALLLLYSNEKYNQKMIGLMKKINRQFDKEPLILKAYNNYAASYYKDKNYEMAEKIASITLDKYPEDPDAALIYSETLQRNNKIAESIRFLEKFLKKNPDQFFLHTKLTYQLLYKGDYKKAFEVAKAAHMININNVDFYFLEAVTLQLQDSDEALKYYNAYLEKLEFSRDLEEREQAAILIVEVLSSSCSNSETYIKLIKQLEYLKTPGAIILVQARFAARMFPEESFFKVKINEIESRNSA